MEFQDVIRARRAVNFFDPDRDVPKDLLRRLLESAARSPSGFNLQPWKVAVLRDPAQKAKLRPLAWDQPKITEAPVILMAETGAVALPPPAVPGDKSLEAALTARQSRRDFDSRPLPEELLSGLLWAGWGINRPELGKRTAPSAQNRQEVAVYVSKADGLFLYDAKAQGLVRINANDLRAATGRQSFVGQAPVNLVYVADMHGGPRDVLRQRDLTIRKHPDNALGRPLPPNFPVVAQAPGKTAGLIMLQAMSPPVNGCPGTRRHLGRDGAN